MTTEDWIDLMRAECERTSQAAVGRRLGYSAGTVCAVLAGSYKGNVARVKARFEDEYLGATVDCPVIGELPRARCWEFQTRRPAATNPLRVQLATACLTCKNRRD